MTTISPVELPTFGALLHALRMQRSLSLSQVARLVPCNKGYLSKIEHDTKFPSSSMARALDQVLNADGALIAVVDRQLAVRAARRRPARAVVCPVDIRPGRYRNAAVFTRVFGPSAALAVVA